MQNFACGDRVVYANYGVCTITNVEERPDFFNPDAIATYYTLESLNPRLGKAMVPAARLETVRMAATKEQALDLIGRMKAIKEDDFFDSGRNITEDHFRAMVKSGELEELVCVAKSMHRRIEQQQAKGKNPSAAYVRLEKDAKARLYGELSYALEIEVGDVEEFILTSVKKDAE